MPTLEEQYPVVLEDLYREVILDHYRKPRNRGSLENPEISAEGYNPLCGDEITLQLALEPASAEAAAGKPASGEAAAGKPASGEVGSADKRQKIRDVKFMAQGCSISQASASMMTQKLKGRTLEEAEALMGRFKAMMHGEPVEDEEAMGDLIALEGVRKFPIRIKCALLAWETLNQGMREHRERATGLARRSSGEGGNRQQGQVPS
jgi:nitrogen fixation NifU-like protein